MTENTLTALPKLLSTEDVASQLGISPATIEKARSTGLGDFPKYIKIGRSVRYLETDVLAWVNSRPSYRSTSEKAV